MKPTNKSFKFASYDFFFICIG